ncbi:RlpA-like double-psi beta-barrel-protein domain-containing protein-containing protein [Crepidotus variabilis]|uniref:RlpA-like double-psi beta-barrel-protein domain-containing protein-containing protein n=1 Tax=Crepidotus variabilis TaxID=179855 RepID=A0A9P6EKB0_9AGAR|nr:RlpA-like double-psi beta-barrel-protein domain-containing protein-containing protein [Crepidotus variabilis]
MELTVVHANCFYRFEIQRYARMRGVGKNPQVKTMFISHKFFVISAVTLALSVQKVIAFNGDATWFHPGPGFGSCGKESNDNDLVVALSTAEANHNSHCGQRIRVNYQGKTVDVTVVDTCPGCSQYSIDLSPAAFQKLAPLSVGRIQVSWNFI